MRVAIFGATGLAGTGVLHAWLQDSRVTEVRAIVRRPLSISQPGLHAIQCDDFANLDPIADALRGLDAVCFCLGISASQAKSKEDYFRITHDFAMAAGLATRNRSPDAVFHFISGAGTSVKSRQNWAKVKGETEEDLAGVGLGGCINWRPAMILPDVQPDRMTTGQKMGSAVAKPFRFIKAAAVGNDEIGMAMIQATIDGRRDGTIENKEIRALADRYRDTA